MRERVAVTVPSTSLLVLDLAGTFTFALNGGLIAVRAARLDVVGVLTLAMITALGGGIVRDVLIGDLPPASFDDWRYIVVALAGGLVVFVGSARMVGFTKLILVFDAMGLSLFAVIGATKALELHLGSMQAVLLGAITGVGGGTLRDVVLRQVPTVLWSGLYAIPALIGAGATVTFYRAELDGLATGIVSAGLCFAIRIVGVRFDLNAPMPRVAVAQEGQPPNDAD